MTAAAPTLRQHFPLYLIEAAGLGVFMLAAGVAGTLLEAPGSALHQLIGDALLRRFVMGLVMGGTAICLIYSPWGARSGAHFNPALTLTFAALHKISAADAAMYVLAQFIGGAIGVLLTLALLGTAFAQPPVRCIVTVPGVSGVPLAALMETAISFILMTATLYCSNRVKLMRYTGLFCGLLIAAFVTFEAPFSGMSMNPARTVASALPSGVWTDAWLYFTAPLAGMMLAAAVYRRISASGIVACAKLNHDSDAPCPFNCRFAAHGIHVPSLLRHLPPHRSPDHATP